MKLPPLFNPSNDMALAANLKQYVPTRHIRQMESDLQSLSRLWDEGPWGWSLAAKQHYLRMGIPESCLPGDAWLDEVRRLSSREFACRYYEELMHAFSAAGPVPEQDGVPVQLLPCRARFLRTMEEVERLEFPPPTCAEYIFKAPWSASGRGNYVTPVLDGETRRRIASILHRQGGIVAEPYYMHKLLDFALEFQISDAPSPHAAPVVKFLGYSLFETDRTGHYGGNLIAAQSDIRRRIPLPEPLLQSLIRYHQARLSRLPYRGPVGIDMMVLEAAPNASALFLHPLVEINFRMTMGLLAILLHGKGMTADCLLTPDRPQGFVCAIRDSKLCITFLP